MAKCFLGGANQAPDAVLARSQGKVPNPYYSGSEATDMLGRRKKYTTQTNYDQGKKTKGDFVFGDLKKVLSSFGFSDPSIVLGPAQRFGWTNTLYVVGKRDAILQVFRAADITPEIIVAPPVFIGICRWGNILTEDRIGVRIKVGGALSPRQDSKKPHFWDTDVTQLLGCAEKDFSVHPAAFGTQIKNILDSSRL